MVGEKPELREPEVPKDLASDPEFALVHWGHLRTDAVGSREVGGVDVLFATRDFVQGAGDFLVPRFRSHGDECPATGVSNRPKTRDQVVAAGLFRVPGHAEDVTQQMAALDSKQRRFIFVNRMTVRTKIADASSAKGDVRKGVDALEPSEAPKGSLSGVSKSRTPIGFTRPTIASSARRYRLICAPKQIGIAPGPTPNLGGGSTRYV